MKRNILYIAVFAALTLSGCKNWLDINRSPNSAEKDLITSDYLLSACQYDLISNMANRSNAMLLSQHLTKSGEVSGNYTFLNGSVMPTDLNDWWKIRYQMISNLNLIYEKSIETQSAIYKGISLSLITWNYQQLVDIFGNAPYSQACKPLEFAQPEYDDAAAIYDNLLVKMDEAIAALEEASKSSVIDPILKKADITCAGNPKQWLKVAHSIKLRLLMRISYVKDVSAQIAALEGKCINVNENVETNPGYYAETDKMNIFYEVYGWDKQGAENNNHRYFMPTSYLVDILRDNNDPRLRVYADPRNKLGNATDANSNYSKFGLENESYIGIPYGDNNPSRKDFTSWTGTGLLAGGADKANGRLRASTFIAGAEIGFFFAEAALRGLIPGGDAKAKEYYEAAVISSMQRHEKAMQEPTLSYNLIGKMKDPISGSAVDAAKAYLAQSNSVVNWDKMTTKEQKLEAICTQKWISFAGYNPFEAWFEQRRNDLPKLKSSHQGQKNKNICRLPYPQTERNLNFNNVSKQPDVDVYETLLFWDLTNPVVEKTERYL